MNLRSEGDGTPRLGDISHGIKLGRRRPQADLRGRPWSRRRTKSTPRAPRTSAETRRGTCAKHRAPAPDTTRPSVGRLRGPRLSWPELSAALRGRPGKRNWGRQTPGDELRDEMTSMTAQAIMIRGGAAEIIAANKAHWRNSRRTRTRAARRQLAMIIGGNQGDSWPVTQQQMGTMLCAVWQGVNVKSLRCPTNSSADASSLPHCLASQLCDRGGCNALVR